jgi:hypothetical protein
MLDGVQDFSLPFGPGAGRTVACSPGMRGWIKATASLGSPSFPPLDLLVVSSVVSGYLRVLESQQREVCLRPSASTGRLLYGLCRLTLHLQCG